MTLTVLNIKLYEAARPQVNGINSHKIEANLLFSAKQVGLLKSI